VSPLHRHERAGEHAEVGGGITFDHEQVRYAAWRDHADHAVQLARHGGAACGGADGLKHRAREQHLDMLPDRAGKEWRKGTQEQYHRRRQGMDRFLLLVERSRAYLACFSLPNGESRAKGTPAEG